MLSKPLLRGAAQLHSFVYLVGCSSAQENRMKRSLFSGENGVWYVAADVTLRGELVCGNGRRSGRRVVKCIIVAAWHRAFWRVAALRRERVRATALPGAAFSPSGSTLLPP